MDTRRIVELKHIRDDLEIYAAKAELVRRAGTGRVHFDKDIYGMFGSLDEKDARNIARGITFALMGLDDGIDHGPVESMHKDDLACPVCGAINHHLLPGCGGK